MVTLDGGVFIATLKREFVCLLVCFWFSVYLFVESFAADGEESIGLWVEDFQMTLTGLRAAQTNRVLAGQTLARSSLLGRAHASVAG